MVKAARDRRISVPFRWDIFILTALCTGMRRGELLNTAWWDIDFTGQKINVSPKDESKNTWQWRIKDTDRRSVPLTSEVVKLLIAHQARQLGRWTVQQGKCPVSNFRYPFCQILEHAGIDVGTFHDLRRTCITNWFAHGLSEFEVMIMAGHASFETARRFYWAVRTDIIERARKASAEAMKGISIAHALHASI